MLNELLTTTRVVRVVLAREPPAPHRRSRDGVLRRRRKLLLTERRRLLLLTELLTTNLSRRFARCFSRSSGVRDARLLRYCSFCFARWSSRSSGVRVAGQSCLSTRSAASIATQHVHKSCDDTCIDTACEYISCDACGTQGATGTPPDSHTIAGRPREGLGNEEFPCCGNHDEPFRSRRWCAEQATRRRLVRVAGHQLATPVNAVWLTTRAGLRVSASVKPTSSEKSNADSMSTMRMRSIVCIAFSRVCARAFTAKALDSISKLVVMHFDVH